jgi:hypothetical protein
LIAAMQQQSERRLELLRRAAAVSDQLTQRVVSTSGQQRSQALVWAQIGDVLEPTPEASAACARALALGEPLLEQDRDGSLRRALAWVASRLAGVQLELGDPLGCAQAAERLAGYAPRALDRVYAAYWFARCLQAESVEHEQCERWRERALVLLEQVAQEPQLDEPTHEALRESAFEVLADEPRYSKVRDALDAKR